MPIRMIAGAAVAAGLVVASCGGDDGGGEGLGEGDDYSVAGALAELPASLDNGDVEIMTSDLNAASETAGLERPDDAGDVDALIDWVNPLTGGPVGDQGDQVAYVPVAHVFNLPRGVQGMGEFHDELGWSLVDADSFVEYSLPPARFSVVSGPYDDETLSDDLIELDGGILTNNEGEDGEQDLEGRSAVDDLGRPVRLARDGDRIASSLQTPTVEEWIDGPDETLADDEDLVAVADILDEADVFSAYLVRRESGFSSSVLIRDLAQDRDEVVDALGERLEEMGLPPSPFDTVGIGWGADDEGAVITIAYQHDSEEAASENADALEELLTEGLSIQSDRRLSDLYDLVAVETDATIAIVTLRPGPEGWPSTAVQALQTLDTPFVHA